MTELNPKAYDESITTPYAESKLPTQDLGLHDFSIICRSNPGGIASYARAKMFMDGELLHGVHDVTFTLKPGQVPMLQITLFAKSIEIEMENVPPQSIEITEVEV
jgi:hypothetical protein